MGALTAGVSGLKAHQAMLDVAGNNLANLNTVGYKASSVTFAELLSQTIKKASGPSGSLGGVNPQQMGSGVGIASVARNMSQGNILSTGQDLDVAIDGEGYFVLNDGDQNVYTRIGSFAVDADNTLVDPSTGYKVQRIGTYGESEGFQIVSDNSIHIPWDASMPARETAQIVINGNLRSTTGVAGPTNMIIGNQAYTTGGGTVTQLTDNEYEVYIDSTLEDGNLTYGELYLKGDSEDEVLITTHVCHPSLCNDNLSGIAVSTMLAQWISDARTRYSYRFLFIPGTIGAITWLALNEGKTPRIKHGLVLAGLGDSGPLTYKKSRRGDAEIDRAMGQVLKDSADDHRILDFTPYGYDERQFCSPGFNLPVGRLSRSVYGQYPEYHTSADDLNFVVRSSLADSFQKILNLVSILENNGRYLNLHPRCEPQLGRRGLYRNPGADEMALLWVLNLSDGQHSLLDICALSRMDFAAVNAAKDTLLKHDLLALAVAKQAGR